MNVRTVELKPARTMPPAAASRPRPGGEAVRVCAATFAVSFVLAVIGRVAQIEALALIGGYGVVFLGIGAAPFQLRPGIGLYARLTGAVLFGFSVLLCVGGLMTDVRGLWSPVAAAVIVGVPAVVLHLIGLRRARAVQADWDELTALLTGAADPREAGYRDGGPKAATRGADARDGVDALDARRPGPGRALAAGWTAKRMSLLWTLVGTVFWLAAAAWTRDPNPTYWGMLTTINPLWYVGLVIVIIGFALGRRTELSAGLATLSFGLATTLTPALVYGAPRDQTAAKQIQIVQYVLAHHHIHVTAGIYQAFSAAFGGVAALAQLLGIHGMLGHMSLWSVATYWPVLLVLMRVAELRFLMGRVLTSTSRRWCGVMLVLLVDSIGQDYFSPQSIGYVMAIGIVAIAMNGVTPRPFGRGTTLFLLTVAGIALAPTHELSPYLAAGALVVLAILGQAPWWTCLPVGVPALLWAGVVHNAISHNFNFGALFNLGNFRPPVTVATAGLHRLAVVGTQSHMLLLALLLLIALGAIGFLANVRQNWAWAYALCPIVGIAFIAINPYGNEGIFRAALFGIPWIAVLAMRMPYPARLLPVRASGPMMTAGIAATLCGLLTTFLISAFAMDGTNVLSPHTLAVVDYLDTLPRHTYVLSVGSANDPAAGADFTYNYHPLEWDAVATGQPELQRMHPTSVDASALADRYGLVAGSRGAAPTSPLYLIWDHSAQLYENAYALQSTTQTNAWRRVLQASPAWRLVRRSGETYLFKLS
jgi:hypothetical protein